MALTGIELLDHDSLVDAPARSEPWPLMAELLTEAILGVYGEKIVHPQTMVMGTVLRTT